MDVLLRVTHGEFPNLDDPRIKLISGVERAKMDTYLTEDLTQAVMEKRQRVAQQKERQDKLKGTEDEGAAGVGETAHENLVPYDPEDDIFVWKPNVRDELMPVVKVSQDLAGSLDESDLPDPMVFLSQCTALTQ